ncbi:MAG: hypothetical protein ACI4IN_04930 [Eubacterium sp.]
MSDKLLIIIAVAGVILLGIFVIPVFNRRSFARLPFEQQVRVLMKQAKGLNYFKNVSSGTKGTLIYVKNKRKILLFHWVLIDGKMLCTDQNPLSNWDYPEEKPQLTDDEVQLVHSQLEQYNKKQVVKFYLQDN